MRFVEANMISNHSVISSNYLSSGLLQQIIDATSAVIYVKDSLCRYTLINRQFEKLFGLSREEIFGLSDFEVFPTEMALAFRENDLKVLSTEEIVECEEIAPHPDGPHTYMSIKFPLHDDRGVVVAIAGISTDITDYLNARTELSNSEQELKTASAVQMALYPKSAPVVPGFEISGVTVPCHITSGDYYDYVPMPDGTLMVVIGDVSGHGLGPALEMVETRASLRAILAFGCPLDEALSRLNKILCQDLPCGMFVSLMVIHLDPKARKMSYASAGHVGHLLKACGETLRLKSTGLVLGIDPESNYSVIQDIPLMTGDIVVLSTDGIAEQMSPTTPEGQSGEMFGWTREMDSIRRARHFPVTQILANLTGDVIQWSRGESQKDDVTAVLIKVL